MKFIITDLKRGVTEPTFLAAVGFSLVVLMISLGYYMKMQPTYEATQAFITCQSLILPFIAPLLAVLPYSNMSMLEKDSGYSRLMSMKGAKKHYIWERLLTNGLIGGMTLMVPLLIFVGICRLFSPYEQIEQIIGVLVLDFCFGVSYATFAYGLTFVNSKRYIPIVTPQVIYLLFIYAFPYLGLDNYYPPLSFSPWILPSKVVPEKIFLQLSILIGIGIVLILASQSYQYLEEKRMYKD